MSNTDDGSVGNGTSLRHELSQLFGLRWETATEWIVIVWISGWLWTSLLQSNWMTIGPLTWSADMIDAAGFGIPGWLTDTSDWLTAQARSWVYWVLISIIVMASTASIGRRAGFRMTAMIALAFAFEVEASWRTLAFIGLGVSALAIAAWIRAWQGSPGDRYWVRLMFLGQVVPLLFAPVVAPVFVLRGVLDAYLRYDRTSPSLALAKEVTRAPRTTIGDVTSTVLRADTMALVAAMTSAHSPREANLVASHFHYEMKQQREQVELNAQSKQTLFWRRNAIPEALLRTDVPDA